MLPKRIPSTTEKMEFQDVPVRNPLLQTGSTSFTTVEFAEHSRTPGPCLEIPVFTGNGDEKFVANFLLILDAYRIASGYTTAYLLMAILQVALWGNAMH